MANAPAQTVTVFEAVVFACYLIIIKVDTRSPSSLHAITHHVEEAGGMFIESKSLQCTT